MKNSIIFSALFAFPFLFSCNQNGHGDAAKTDSLSAAIDTTVKKQCFIAIDGKDTANLSFSSLNSGKVSGHLVINYLDKGKNDGDIEGTFRGDTLFVDYTFKIGTTNKTIYKNPLALLKKDGKLLLGVGQIETNLGRSYFVKDKAISFDKGRFTFTPEACKD